MDSTSKLKEDDLAALVHEQVGKSPDAVAVIYDDNRDACCVSITYLEMWNRASAVSENLTKHGVQAETVGVCLEPCVNLPSVLLGILQTSSCFYPFGSDGQGFVQQSVQRLSVRHIILDHTSLETLQPLLLQINVQLLSCPELQSLGLCLVRIDTRSEAAGNCRLPSVQQCPGLAYCITTSGTTGTPKIVRVPHACIVPNIVDLKREFKPGVGDVTFLTSPLTFDPSMIDIFVTLTSGAALLIVPSAVKMLADSLLTMLSSRHSVTILQRQLQDTLFGENSALRVLVIGGEPFPSRNTVLQSMSSVNSTAVYNIYGITEVSCWASLHCVRLPNGLSEDPVPIGCPLTGTKIKVVGESGEDVLCGTGEIWIGGSERVCLLDDETEDILTGDVVWRPTGDLGRVDESGRIFCLGRNDRQIKRNGKRLNLSTLQQVCCEVECVADSWATYSKGHLYLFVVGKEDAGINKEEMMVKVRSHLEQMLPSQYQPDTITAVSSMPVNRHGKLDAAVLLEMCGVGDRKSSGVIVPVEIWAQNLWQNSTGPGKTISFSDNFLTSGGDSLKAVHLAECTESHLGQKVPQLLDVILTGTYQDFLNLLRSQSEILSAADRPKRKQDFLEGGRKKQKIQATDSTPQPAETDGEVDEDGVRVERTCEINGAKMEMYHTAAENNGYLSTHAENVALDTDITDSSDGDEILKMPLTSSHSISRHFLTGNPGNADQAAPTAHRQKILPKASESNDETASGTVTADGKTVCERAMGSPSRCDDFVTSVGRGGTITHHTMEVQAFFAILMETGNVLWCTRLGGRIEGSACLSACGRLVVVGCYDHHIYMLDVHSGDVVWRVQTGNAVKCTPVTDLSSGLLLCGSHDGHLAALHCQSSGETVWRKDLKKPVFSSPVVDDDQVYVGCVDGGLYCLNIQTGDQKWVFWTEGPIFSSPTVTQYGRSSMDDSACT
ncbi:hypothetical protein BaRGS_00013464 [Batillaria attramentaria]|uniref:Carrier domain-containing protein n=1 Tax=Batillaria attramentaria TaxID=370345 RepID=A0ABD0L7Z2_9CAEN